MLYAKLTKVALVLLIGASVVGCASQDYAMYTKGQVEIEVAKHNSAAAKYKAMEAIAAQGDSSAKVAAVMALALGSNSSTTQSIAAPQPNQALQWASILVPSLTQVAGMRYQYLSSVSQSTNAASVAQSTNEAFVGIAGKIQSNTASTINNTTLSGTGNLGTGTFSTADSTAPATIVTQPAPLVVLQPEPIIVQPVQANVQ